MNLKYATLKTEHGITTVTLNNPPANTLSSSCIAELRSLFRELARDEETKAIIITGEGRFCGGSGYKEFVSKLGDQKQGLALAQGGQALCDEIEASKNPSLRR